MNTEQRLTDLALELGYDTGDGGDWDKPLLKMANSVAVEFTRPGGANGHPMDRRDVREGIVSKVFEAWARDEKITVEYVTTEVRNIGGWLRQQCRFAAQNWIAQEVDQYRSGVKAYGLTTDEDEPGVLHTTRYASPSAEHEWERGSGNDLVRLVLLDWVGIAEGIIDSVEDSDFRDALRLYVFEGMQQADIATRLDVPLAKINNANRRGVKDAEAIACLVVVRNVLHKGVEGTGRAPKAPKVPPTKLIEAAERRGIRLTEIVGS